MKLMSLRSPRSHLSLMKLCLQSMFLCIFYESYQLKSDRHIKKIPTGLIVTGPSIALQELLFSQLAERLKFNAEVLVVVLRSSDATNLKAVLKKLIRDVSNRKHDDCVENLQQDVSCSNRPSPRKLMMLGA
jgi:hypothetical protein